MAATKKTNGKIVQVYNGKAGALPILRNAGAATATKRNAANKPKRKTEATKAKKRNPATKRNSSQSLFQRMTNPSFGKVGGLLTQATMGAAGAISAKAAVGVAERIVTLPQHRLSRPVATGLAAMFVVAPLAGRLPILKKYTNEIRAGGLVAAVLEAFEIYFPQIESRAINAVTGITSGLASGLALPPATQQAIVAQAATRAANDAAEQTAAALAGMSDGAMFDYSSGVEANEDLAGLVMLDEQITNPSFNSWAQ